MDRALVTWTGWVRTYERRLAFLPKVNYLVQDDDKEFASITHCLSFLKKKLPSSWNLRTALCQYFHRISRWCSLHWNLIFVLFCFVLITTPSWALTKRLWITHRVAWLVGTQQHKLAVIFLGSALGFTKLLRSLIVCKVHHLLNFLLILHLRRAIDLNTFCPILIWLLFVLYLNDNNAGVLRSSDL